MGLLGDAPLGHSSHKQLSLQPDSSRLLGVAYHKPTCSDNNIKNGLKAAWKTWELIYLECHFENIFVIRIRKKGCRGSRRETKPAYPSGSGLAGKIREYELCALSTVHTCNHRSYPKLGCSVHTNQIDAFFYQEIPHRRVKWAGSPVLILSIH